MLINFGFREGAPISSRLNAVDLYLVVCIFFVFGNNFVLPFNGVKSSLIKKTLFVAALLEYAAILLLLKKRRKPLMKLEQGMKNIPETGMRRYFIKDGIST